MKKVELYADGACSGNPGPGGWGTILQYGTVSKELSGGAHHTTNNRMELTAIIEGLGALKEPCEVSVTTDSQYVVNAINKGWLFSWAKKNWKKSDGKYVANVDLWEQLMSLMKIHSVTFTWVKGHAGHPMNERCDQLAVMRRDSVK